MAWLEPGNDLDEFWRRVYYLFYEGGFGPMAARKASQVITLLATAVLPFLLVGAVNWPAIVACAEEANGQPDLPGPHTALGSAAAGNCTLQEPSTASEEDKSACTHASEHLFETDWVAPAMRGAGVLRDDPQGFRRGVALAYLIGMIIVTVGAGVRAAIQLAHARPVALLFEKCLGLDEAGLQASSWPSVVQQVERAVASGRLRIRANWRPLQGEPWRI